MQSQPRMFHVLDDAQNLFILVPPLSKLFLPPRSVWPKNRDRTMICEWGWLYGSVYTDGMKTDLLVLLVLINGKHL